VGPRLDEELLGDRVRLSADDVNAGAIAEDEWE
jgi:hypothetical protein